jgi:putative transposase
MGRVDNLLDNDDHYLELGKTSEDRKRRYAEFLQTAISISEQQFIQDSVSRNQLTGIHQFVDEIERRTGLRVERRGRGRPRYDEK